MGPCESDKVSSALIGAAGVHFVAARLNALGFQCAPTIRNAPNVDLLVSDTRGLSPVSLQVKTAWSALRLAGRGLQKSAHHYEWDIGWKSVELACEASSKPNAGSLFFALVDLREFRELPDVFVVPPSVIAGYFAPGVVPCPDGTRVKAELAAIQAHWPRARYHQFICRLDTYRNEWEFARMPDAEASAARLLREKRSEVPMGPTDGGPKRRFWKARQDFWHAVGEVIEAGDLGDDVCRLLGAMSGYWPGLRPEGEVPADAGAGVGPAY